MNKKLDFTDEGITRINKEGDSAELSNVKNTKLSNAVHLLTALCFMFFTAYHLFLFVEVSSNRIGRILGILTFLLITVASFFALSPKPTFRIVRSVTMIVGLSLNFIIKLFNAPLLFGSLDFSDIPSVLNVFVYIFAQTAELLLLLFYLIFRHNSKLNSKRKLVIGFMSFVILLYVSCLIMECVLILKYYSNIDLSIKFTLISRFLYCFGFVGIAVSFMLPVNKIDSQNDMMNQAPDDDDFMFSVPDGGHSHVDKANKPAIGEVDKDFVL